MPNNNYPENHLSRKKRKRGNRGGRKQIKVQNISKESNLYRSLVFPKILDKPVLMVKPTVREKFQVLPIPQNNPEENVLLIEDLIKIDSDIEPALEQRRRARAQEIRFRQNTIAPYNQVFQQVTSTNQEDSDSEAEMILEVIGNAPF